MSRVIPTSERILRARAFVQKAREIPVPVDTGLYDLSYVAEVKGLLRQARDLIKFIPYSPSATPEIKQEVSNIFKEADQAEKDILHK
jgi:hypothetical protein